MSDNEKAPPTVDPDNALLRMLRENRADEVASAMAQEAMLTGDAAVALPKAATLSAVPDEPVVRSERLESAIKAIDDPTYRTTPRRVARMFADYHDKHPDWGTLARVMDAGRHEDSAVQLCIDEAAKKGDEDGEILARILLKLSRSQRQKLPAMVVAAGSRIVTPDGRKAVEAASETGALDCPPFSFFVELIKKWCPLDTPGTKSQKAMQLYERHPKLAAAYRAGLEQGRDLRERSLRGLGWWWDELAELTPRERGYIIDKVRDELGIKAPIPARHS